MAAVVFPLPGPVFTMMRPRRRSDIEAESSILRGSQNLRHPCRMRLLKPIYGNNFAKTGEAEKTPHNTCTVQSAGFMVERGWCIVLRSARFTTFEPPERRVRRF